jgi:hypothetical protein
MFGQVDPKFLVTQVSQNYSNESNSYLTTLTLVKDSYQRPIEKMAEGVIL